jgi:predicted porin
VSISARQHEADDLDDESRRENSFNRRITRAMFPASGRSLSLRFEGRSSLSAQALATEGMSVNMTRFVLLAALCDVAGTASAQSSVSLYGVVDLAARYVKADGQARLFSEASGGLNSAQLGVRGSEDLGGGLRAGFNIQGDMFPDTGAASSPKFWNRMSILYLAGNFGELRLGRDYTPTYLTFALYDPAGRVGVGAAGNVRQMFGGIRMDNTVQYFLPGQLGGVYGSVMVALGEGGTAADRPGRYVGGRVGYSAGPIDIAVAAGEQGFDVATTLPFGNSVIAAPGDKQKTYAIGGSWKFGDNRLMGSYTRDTLRGNREDTIGLGAITLFGNSEVRAGYDRSKLRTSAGGATSVDQLKATYAYHLSKRTALYGSVARLDNKDSTRLTIPGAAGFPTAGGKFQAAEFGIRHFF